MSTFPYGSNLLLLHVAATLRTARTALRYRRGSRLQYAVYHKVLVYRKVLRCHGIGTVLAPRWSSTVLHGTMVYTTPQRYYHGTALTILPRCRHGTTLLVLPRTRHGNAPTLLPPYYRPRVPSSCTATALSTGYRHGTATVLHQRFPPQRYRHGTVLTYHPHVPPRFRHGTTLMYRHGTVLKVPPRYHPHGTATIPPRYRPNGTAPTVPSQRYRLGTIPMVLLRYRHGTAPTYCHNTVPTVPPMHRHGTVLNVLPRYSPAVLPR